MIVGTVTLSRAALLPGDRSRERDSDVRQGDDGTVYGRPIGQLHEEVQFRFSALSRTEADSLIAYLLAQGAYGTPFDIVDDWDRAARVRWWQKELEESEGPARKVDMTIVLRIEGAG